MGRMKDRLGGNPPTIGDSRRMGMTTVSVHCAAPCGHVAKLAFDDLRLPDSTVFIEIPLKRRLVCRACGRRAREIAASWNEVPAYGNGSRPLSTWIVVVRLPDGTEARSSDAGTRDRALTLASGLAAGGDVVLRIEGPGGDIAGEDLAAALAQRGA